MRTEKLPPFENVVASSTAILPRIPQGETYEEIIFELGGTTFTKAHVSNIRIRLGGKLVADITGSHLDDVTEYMGRTANAAYLSYSFADPNARTINGESIGAVDTSDPYSSFSIEVDIGAATAPTLEAWARLSPPKTGPNAKVFKAMLKATESIGAAGTFNLNVPLGSKAGTLLKRLHLFHANVTQLDVKRDGLILQGDGETGIMQYIQNDLTRTTQSGMFVFDPLVRDNQSDAIPTARPDGNPASFQFSVTTSASDTITMYSELYTTLDRL